MLKKSVIWSLIVLVLLLLEVILGQIKNNLCQEISINEADVYEEIEMINGKYFNDLVDQEDTSQKTNVYFSIEYPEDKQVVIFNKKHNNQSTLFIENNNGLAKVVDVAFDGKVFAFNKYYSSHRGRIEQKVNTIIFGQN